MLRIFAQVLTITLLGSISAEAADPLSAARQLAAGRYAGWTYGSDASSSQIDCVQFVLAVAEECLQASLAEVPRTRILIADLTEEERQHEHLEALILANDSHIRGVQSALVDANLGEEIPTDEAQSGDLIQYWMKTSNGIWFGHAGVIESVDRSAAVPTAKIFGAHKSQNGIATSSFDLKLIAESETRRVYVVRMH